MQGLEHDRGPVSEQLRQPDVRHLIADRCAHTSTACESACSEGVSVLGDPHKGRSQALLRQDLIGCIQAEQVSEVTRQLRGSAQGCLLSPHPGRER
jgi:hypothetical protein